MNLDSNAHTPAAGKAVWNIVMLSDGRGDSNSQAVLHSLSDLLVVPPLKMLLPFRVAMLNSSRLPLQTVLHSLPSRSW